MPTARCLRLHRHGLLDLAASANRKLLILVVMRSACFRTNTCYRDVHDLWQIPYAGPGGGNRLILSRGPDTRLPIQQRLTSGRMHRHFLGV